MGGLLNAVNTVILHRHQETRRHLWALSSRIKKGRCGMCIILLRHIILRRHDILPVIPVNTEGHPHPHMLRAFHNRSINLIQLRPRQCLHTELINKIIPVILNGLRNLALLFLR